MFTKEIPIPDGIKVEVDGGKISVAKGETKLTRDLWHPAITIVRRDSLIEVATASSRRKIRALIGTFASHITNMIKGVDNGFEYRMKVVYAHFPVQLKGRV